MPWHLTISRIKAEYPKLHLIYSLDGWGYVSGKRGRKRIDSKMNLERIIEIVKEAL